MTVLDYCRQLMASERETRDDTADLLLDVHTACETMLRAETAEVKALYNAYIAEHECGPPGALLAPGDEKGASLVLQLIRNA